VVDGGLVATRLQGPPPPPPDPPGPTIASVEGLAFRPVQTVTSLPADHALVGERIAWSDGGTSALGFSSQCPPVQGGCGPDWTTDLGATLGNATARGAGQVVYTDASGTVSVLDVATGAVAWQAELGEGRTTQATVSPSRIFVGTEGGRLAVLPADGCGAASCTPLWEGTVGGSARFVLSVGDVVFIATAEGTVAAFDADGCGAATCAPLVTVAAGGAITGSPIVHAGKLIVGRADGLLVAFGLPD
jgi:outer membrane protein assembly factor BamB